jgi:hypothetical protein
LRTKQAIDVASATLQPLDSDLTAVAGLGTTGIIVRSGAGTAVTRAVAAGTGLTVADGTGVAGNPTLAADIASQAEAEAGTSSTKLMTPQRTAQAAPGFVQKNFAASTTYTPPTGVKEIYVMVFGSTGGSGATLGRGGVGGPGYAEKKYSTPFTGAPYTITIGAGGVVDGNGGTTSFDTVSITGSGGTTSATGGVGGVATGGDFNANGGAGGLGRTASVVAGGGGGGAGTRAGVGGIGGAAAAGQGGGGGGTGGNDASGVTPGIAATAVDVNALTLPPRYIGDRAAVTFSGGGVPSGQVGGNGAGNSTSVPLRYPVTSYSSGQPTLNFGGLGGQQSFPGLNGYVSILEVY